MYYSLISSMKKAPAIVFDSDAQSFITAAGITNSTQQSAINTLVLDLKSYGIWSKMNALYPMVGGTATTHKYNLKDPRDLDAAFRLQFNGGGTHSANGYLPNGTTAYANTFFSNLNNNCSIWAYSRTNLLGVAQLEMGVFSTGSNNGIGMGFSDGNTYLYENIATGGQVQYTATNTLGFFGANRTSSTLLNGWHNGVKKGTNTNTSGATATIPIYIGGYNSSGTLQYASTRELAFSAIAIGLTDAEAANFYTAVQNFQTTLTRNV